MAFDRITDGDLLGKGNLGRPDTPGVDTTEMQRILDELPREVLVPAFNRLAGQLEAASAAASLGADVPAGLPEDTPATVQGTLEAVLTQADTHAAHKDNPHGVTAAQTGAYTKAETEEAISRRVVEIGAGDMAQAIYDPAGERRDVFAAIRQAVDGAGHMKQAVYAAKGEPGAVDRALTADTALTAASADDGVKVYTHSKSGTVHDFSGSGPNGRAMLTADVEEGDTFTVNGKAASAFVGAEEAAKVMAGSRWNGRWVTFVFDGEAINFKGGDGLTAADRAKLIPENIRDKVTVAKVTGVLKPSPIVEIMNGTGMLNGYVDKKKFTMHGDSQFDGIYTQFSDNYFGAAVRSMVTLTPLFSGPVTLSWLALYSYGTPAKLQIQKNGEDIVNKAWSVAAPPIVMQSEYGETAIEIKEGDSITIDFFTSRYEGSFVKIS